MQVREHDSHVWTATPARQAMRILVIEDDREAASWLVKGLAEAGHIADHAADGEEGLAAFHAEEPDLVVLDVMMPKLDGYGVCQELRKESDVPIVMLTALGDVADRITGLELGADDYVVKPFALEELSARVRSMLRRTLVTEETQNLVVADLVLDLRSRTAHRGKRELVLTKTEFDLLELLMQNVGIVLERDMLYDRIWGFNFETGSRSLDVYIGYLRRKTEEGGEPRVLHTIRGVGYIVRPPSESDWEEKV